MIVQVKELEKTYKNGLKALNGVSLEVREKEIYGLLGPNGSGKTTTINCILQLLKFDKGEILLFDEEMKPSRLDLKSKIGLVPQNVAVFNELTVYDNIDFFCGLYIKDKKLRKQYVEEAIAFVSLEDYKKFYPKKLSGGLLRRLNIACGIVHKPELIIFDEPTVAVDPQSRNKILEGILKLNEAGSTIIYTSHYMEEVEQICSYIVIMDKGEVIAHGTKEKLKESIELGATVTIQTNKEAIDLFRDKEYVLDISYKEKELTIQTKKGNSYLPTILDILEKNKMPIGRVYTELPTLNDVFLKLTGKELRD
ncbi:MAG: ABC transporter ATP-binding protein [Acholeplasmatales bacterium]|jgi:ABC-2 type transport system ATP-binding protein|nr:ABC transporter ATP-binding protein [Acholeplasmatales bacterium]